MNPNFYLVEGFQITTVERQVMKYRLVLGWENRCMASVKKEMTVTGKKKLLRKIKRAYDFDMEGKLTRPVLGCQYEDVRELYDYLNAGI